MVVAALTSLQRIASDANGLSVAIDDGNRRHAHIESVLKAGVRIAGTNVECSELNIKPMAIAANKMLDAGNQKDIFGDSDGCMSGSKQEHTELAYLLTALSYKMVEGLIWRIAADVRRTQQWHGCADNDVMVLKLVEALRWPALEYYNSLQLKSHCFYNIYSA